MDPTTVVMWAFIAGFAWAGLGCLASIARFHDWPLAILGAGLLLWLVGMVLVLRIPQPSSDDTPVPPLALLALGTCCILGYRLAFYRGMRERGISPRRLLAFGLAGAS